MRFRNRKNRKNSPRTASTCEYSQFSDYFWVQFQRFRFQRFRFLLSVRFHAVLDQFRFQSGTAKTAYAVICGFCGSNDSNSWIRPGLHSISEFLSPDINFYLIS